jgi:isocitrate/isopropylmalate dehydrogenase
MGRPYDIAVIPGDGIGKEVIPEGSRYGLDDHLHLKYACQGNLA